MIEFNGEADHVHLLFQYYPQMELPKFVSNLKSVSSRRLRSEFAERVDQFYWQSVLWNEFVLYRQLWRGHCLCAETVH